MNIYARIRSMYYVGFQTFQRKRLFLSNLSNAFTESLRFHCADEVNAYWITSQKRVRAAHILI